MTKKQHRLCDFIHGNVTMFAPVGSFRDFSSAVQGILSSLQHKLGMSLWMVTRVDRDDMIVVEARDRHYGVQAGFVLRWTESLCWRMVRGLGPSIAPDAMSIPEYAQTQAAHAFSIGAYLGIPLRRGDSSLWGTLCAIDPRRQSPSLCEALPLLKLAAGLIGSLVDLDAQSVAQSRTIERMAARSMRDSLTGLFDRGGWEALASAEALRAQRHGGALAVVSIDLDGSTCGEETDAGCETGDGYLERLCRAAFALRSVSVDDDVLARTGSESVIAGAQEFALLLINCSSARAFLMRLQGAFESLGIGASFGAAEVNGDWHAAMESASSARQAMRRSRFGLGAAGDMAAGDSRGVGGMAERREVRVYAPEGMYGAGFQPA